jgi:uncharacterized lipoprotein YmbA
MRKTGFIFGLIMLVSTGCSSILIKSTPAPSYYQIEYAPYSPSCSAGFQQGVRIWPFTASPPFDRSEMVVERDARQVELAGNDLWVATPGTLLAQSLIRDLSGGDLFPLVVGSDDPTVVPFELTGHIYDFAWQKSNSAMRAKLHVEVDLLDTTQGSKKLFHSDYDLRSKPFVDNSPRAFASGMSDLVRQFSRKLSADLCHAARSQPAAE